MGGDGTIGTRTGTTTPSFTTTTPTSHGVELSSIATTLITHAGVSTTAVLSILAPASAVIQVPMGIPDLITHSEHHNLDPADRTLNEVAMPAPLVGSITAAWRTASPRVDSRASVEVSTEAEVFTGVGEVFTAVAVATAAAVTDDSSRLLCENN
jgi:hypothetical protein